MGALERNEGHSGDALFTDQYTLTMSQSFWRHQQDQEEASFELFVRTLPKNRGFLVCAGLESALDYLESFHFTGQDIDFLRSLGIYDESFLKHLAGVRFTGSVSAIPEGTIVGAQFPLLRVSAPRLEAAIVEPALLAIVNHQTMIASKAARITHAAKGKPVFDFSMRRLQGLGPALGVARASYLAGFSGTATVAAGRELGIPTVGTMAHHFIQSFGPEREVEAFAQFLTDYPGGTTLLVDTYDTISGIENAIAAIRQTGVLPKAIRLDSGDLADLAQRARMMFDAAGCQSVQIFASNDLDEYAIDRLERAGAPIDGYGVGTMLGTSADAPSLGGVYKLVAQELPAGDLRPGEVMKLAEGKETDPGTHQIWRLRPHHALLGMSGEPGPPMAWPMIEEVMEAGVRTRPARALEAIRRSCLKEIEALPEIYKRAEDPERVRLDRTEVLTGRRRDLSMRQSYREPALS